MANVGGYALTLGGRLRGVAVGAIVAISAMVAAGPMPATAAITTAPVLTSPAPGATLTSFGPTLTWSNPGGVTQYHLQVVPANNDGPGVDVHVGEVGNSFDIPAPPLWYGLLPDMTYTWRVRVSDAATFVSLTDASWSPFAEAKFRTPKVTSTGITPVTPANGNTVTTKTPGLMFSNTNSSVFYYQVQLSKDATFNEDPGTATAMVYSSLIHGGVSVPRRTYSVPTSAPLEDKTTYYWRVRPRVQGDGTQVEWSSLYVFKTDFSAAAAAAISQVSIGSEAGAQGSCVAGKAAASYPANPDLTRLYYGLTYTGSATAVRIWYRDGIPFTPAAIDLKAGDTCFGTSTSIYAGLPLFPGAHKLEVWYAGQPIASSSVTIGEASALAVGAISVGTAPSSTTFCGVTGTATAFAPGTATLFARWNSVGPGNYTVRLFQGTNTTPVATSPISAFTPVDCWIKQYPSITNGTWKIDIIDAANKVLAATTVTVG